MQEKKNKRLFFLLMLLLSVTAAVFVFIRTDSNPVVDKQVFKVDDLTSIDRVVLESANGKVELAYNGSRWLVNNRYDADAGMIDVLFATLREAEPKRIIPPTLQDSVAQIMNKNGVRVSLFRSGNEAKEFIGGGNKAKTQAWFQDPVNNRFYIVHIPGYRVYVSGILELSENEWRDKYVFSFNWRNFQGLEVYFPGKPVENFTVAMNNNSFGIQGLSQVDTAKLNTFLDKVSLLTVDQYSSKNVQDSLMKITPAMIITVKDIAKRQYSLKLFPGKDGQVSGIISDSQYVYFDRQKIQPLMRTRSFFIKQ